jgi:hypothetical protein
MCRGLVLAHRPFFRHQLHRPYRPSTFRKDKQEAKGIRADNRQKDMNLSKMYVDEEGG